MKEKVNQVIEFFPAAITITFPPSASQIFLTMLQVWQTPVYNSGAFVNE